MRAGELIVEILTQYGVRHVFGMPGDAINDLTFAMHGRDDIDFVLVRHEEAGAFAASAAAKLTGRLGVCMGTAGGGAIHLLNGLYDAALDHAPVLAITGQVPTEFIGTGYHQEVDLERLFAEPCVYSRAVTDPGQLPGVLLEAVKAALAERGPAHINLPTNVGSQRVATRAAEVINAAGKVAILAGIGAASARDEVIALARHLKAPILRTLRAKDWIDDDHPDCAGGLGLLGGTAGSKAMEGCDCLILIGADYPYRDFYPKSACVVQIEPDLRRMGKRAEIDAPLVGHARPTIEALLPELAEKSDETFRGSILARHRETRKANRKGETSDAAPIRPERLMAEIGAAAPEDAIFTCDTGTANAWTARHLAVGAGQRFTLSSGLGTMGFALPGAIGAALAHPGRRVIAIAGDGGFAMLMADFVTAARLGLPITVVVLDNAKLGFIALEQEGKGLPEHSIDLVNPDFCAFAEACGGIGVRVEAPGDLAPALSRAMEAPGASVVSVATDPDAVIMPPRITLAQAYHFGLSKLRENLG